MAQGPTVETQCPRCGARLRVPADKRGEAGCPRCLRIFDWEPPVFEVMTLPMRCAVTDQEYLIQFGRQRSSDQFAIRGYDIDDGATSPLGRPAAPQTFAEKDVNFGAFRCPLCRHDGRCGTEIIASFARCGRCSRLVCGGRSERRAFGRVVFRCTRSCGACDMLSDNPITSYFGTLQKRYAPSGPALGRGAQPAALRRDPGPALTDGRRGA
jgi:hypothetical protein